MSSTEKRAVISLSSIMSLRMIGLFMVLPVFTLYAAQLSGSSPFLIGLAMGIYGLFQAIFQIPFGVLSDRYGRKIIICVGLAIFVLGSLLAGFAHSMTLMIIGRALQGMGAVGSSILAMMADLTREEQRTKSMAIAGITIGLSFGIAFLIGPLLTKWISVGSLFYLAALLGIAGIGLLYFATPTPITVRWHRDTEPELKSFLLLLKDPALLKLNIGIFILHAIFIASFIVIPINLKQNAHFAADQQWIIYLPTLLIASIIGLVGVGMAERKQQLKPYFLSGIVALLCSELLFWYAADHILLIALGLCLFFGGFTMLEGFLPSLISRTAPASRKGSALGIYSCAQFSGIFIGGILGGWLYGKFSFSGVYLFCVSLSLFWLIIAYLMQAPRALSTHLFRLSKTQQSDWGTIAAKLHAIPGMIEVTFIAEDGVAYLKMERGTAKHPEFIQLKESSIEPI